MPHATHIGFSGALFFSYRRQIALFFGLTKYRLIDRGIRYKKQVYFLEIMAM
jgi:hypothetical protein